MKKSANSRTIILACEVMVKVIQHKNLFDHNQDEVSGWGQQLPWCMCIVKSFGLGLDIVYS